jgi:hypothetical protein
LFNSSSFTIYETGIEFITELVSEHLRLKPWF